MDKQSDFEKRVEVKKSELSAHLAKHPEALFVLFDARAFLLLLG
jgi:hypothetical protein